MNNSLVVSIRHSLFLGASVAAISLMIAAPAAAQQADAVESVIVTGTHVQGIKAEDSSAPIAVVGSDALMQGSGTGDLRSALSAAVPSFTTQQYGASFGNLSLSATLRGLSPNDVLVLVDGHRRHYSGIIHAPTTSYTGNYDSGSTGADLSFLPKGAIDHVEVLLDGAAAQYGTDALAGVVNIILKKNPDGGDATVTGGQYYNGQGQTYDLSVNKGIPLGDKGFLNVTVNKQSSGFTQYGGTDSRYINAQGQVVPQNTVTGVGANGVATLSAVGSGVPDNYLKYVPGYPYSNSVYNNPEIQLTQAEANISYHLSDDVELYGFGTFGHKSLLSYQIYRQPNVLIATAGSNQACSASNLNGYNTALNASGVAACAVGIGGGITPLGTNGLNSTGQVISSGNAGNLFSSTMINSITGAALPTATGQSRLGTQPEYVMYPGGFRPLEGLKEDDYQYNLGVRFNLAGWAMDLNGGYGKDIDNIYTLNSGNESLLLDTHTTPTNFYDGNFVTGQFTGTLDATRTFDVGLASPLTATLGTEAREDYYGVGAGDAASYYGTGAQARVGFPPNVAGAHTRKNYAGYFDFAVMPISALQVDVAGRFEHYTDFGDTEIGKITARYDFNPMFAVRGTISTGFRAPTLAEEYYTNVSVTPTTATIQLAANTPSARVLGLSNLKPENSTNYSVGLVAKPLDGLSMTLDAYSIVIGNRISISSQITAKGGAINAPALVGQAIALTGNTLDSTVATQGVTAFLNALSTRTRGVDLTANYATDFADYGSVNWSVGANYNETAITSIAPVPAVLLAGNPNASFFNYQTQYNFIHSTPNMKGVLSADWELDQFGATLRENLYGPQHSYVSPNSGGELIPSNQASVGLLDGEVRYRLTDQVQFAFGGNNLFDVRTDSNTYVPGNCATAPGVVVPQGGSCVVGPNRTNGQSFPADNSSSNGSPALAPWNPNGGYYYARVSFNF